MVENSSLQRLREGSCIFLAGPVIKKIPYSIEKEEGEVVGKEMVIEHLFCMHELLNSIPNSTETMRKKSKISIYSDFLTIQLLREFP